LGQRWLRYDAQDSTKAMKKKPGWIFRKRYRRRIALKKRQVAAAIDALIDGEIKRILRRT
jgi:hypothetical protein